MAWVNIPDTSLDPDAPLTSQLAFAWRDNPIAIAEGAEGAPVITGIWHPYDMAAAGDGADGELWSFAVDGAVSEVETPNFADGFEYQLLCDELSGSATADFRIGLFLATSESYINADVVTAVNSEQARSIQATIHRPRDVSRTHALEYIGWTWDGSASTTGGMNTFSIQNNTAQKIGKARVSISIGTFDAGRIRLFRRKLYG